MSTFSSAFSTAQPFDSALEFNPLWALDPSITYLNHGSFGACPHRVLEKQQALRTQMEAGPVRFFEEMEPWLDAARLELANFIGANPDHLAFVPNATTGVNTVLRSLPLQPGDELLTIDHEYNASRNALDFAAAQSGAAVVVAEVPFPIDSAEQVIAAVLEQVTARTRLVLLDHVTSQSALILPIEPLIRALSDRGIDVLIDGAHAPGMVPLNLETLGAAYYTGNCHKWLCAPKGAAFLYVRPDRLAQLRPLVISHGANSPRQDRSRFRLEFDWTGTADPTPYLCIPEAIQYLGSLLPGGWATLMQQNRSLALAARSRLCEILQVAPPCPEDMIGAMAALPLPDGPAAELQAQLFDRFQIEIPVIPWKAAPQRVIRLSAQLYNEPADYDGLAGALQALLSSEQAEI